MKSLTRGHLKAGLDSVRGSKMRNFWTMFGVIIGVASVITVVSIGEGIKQQISQQIHQFGKDLITVQPVRLQDGSGINGAGTSVLSSVSVASTLSEKDVALVAATKGVSASAPLSAAPGTIKGDNGTYKGGLVIGTSADLPGLLNQSIAYGVFLTNEDAGSNVAVLGQTAAERLFNQEVPLGRTFMFRGQSFMVRGIFNQFNTTPLSPTADFNNAIFIPYDVAQSITKDNAPTFEVLAKPSNPSQTAQTVASIQKSLNNAHDGESDFSVLQQSQNVASSNAVLDLLTRLIAGVAAISLLVGGIGIMNVMLVSVAERMHEIGIRKALGATNRQILSQFMIEATVLSLGGGLIGIGLAFLIDIALRVTTDIQPIISWQVVLLASGVSLLVGVLFGSIPALKAARKHPIEALRAE